MRYIADMRFPRCIRLDASDVATFHRAAAPGEWAVPGGFAFAGRDPARLDPKERIAFRGAWLGTESFGWSTLAEIAEMTEAEFFQVVERLARHFVDAYGAPDLVSALPVARAEADYAAGLCEHKLHTLLALERDVSNEGIVERFRIVTPPRPRDHARIWEIAEVPDAGAAEAGGNPGTDDT